MTASTKAQRDETKRLGSHFTPPALAKALAERLSKALPDEPRDLSVLDPACGDGALLAAVGESLRSSASTLRLRGFDVDERAIEIAKDRLGQFHCTLSNSDFLEGSGDADSDLWSEPGSLRESFDVVVANPPYVRTQTIGAEASRSLARRFGLSGRVDLAHAFSVAMINSLKPGGTFAIILSNKVLTTNAGTALREYLLRETELTDIWDLGDTQIFSAAVLPVVVFGTRNRLATKGAPRFKSIYEVRRATEHHGRIVASSDSEALREFDNAVAGSEMLWKGRSWEIRDGLLHVAPGSGKWNLSDANTLSLRRDHATGRVARFGSAFQVRVGIKTTADAVFVRQDWDSIAKTGRPEPDLLWPIRLARDSKRWYVTPIEALSHRVLYPYVRGVSRRTTVNLDHYPGAAAYLECHRGQLEGRHYVMASGREWFEPWVAHEPSCWLRPRVIFRDISAEPMFAFDDSTAVPQGTLYWLRPRGGASIELLKAACVVANSRFGRDFYDYACGTRLYSGRRRYMTQFVNEFPLPTDDRSVEVLATLCDLAIGSSQPARALELARIEREIDGACDSLLRKVD